MKRRAMLPVLALIFIAGCDEHFRTLWHGQTLASGGTIKVTSFNLAWGIEHDDRDVRKDGFALEYVSAMPGASAAAREAEAVQAFELVRAVSERWEFRFASLAAFPTLERKGRYDLYWFERQSDGRWTFTHSEPKVFAKD